MSIYKRGKGIYWTDFTVDGQRHRKSLETTNWKEALRQERLMIGKARKGQLARQAEGPKRLHDAISTYLHHKTMRCSPRTLELETERLAIVKKHFGDLKLTSITPASIAHFQEVRHEAGIANRTINMDVGVLRRVLKHAGRWKALEDHVANLPENQKPIGRALSREERQRLFEAAAINPDWEHVYCAAVLAANTSLRPVEVKHLQWKDIDLAEGTVTVRRSKNMSSHRVIPLNQSARQAMVRRNQHAESQGFSAPDHYIWPASQWNRIDPNRPAKSWDNAWRSLTKKAGLGGLRFHDLRHTIITELAEMGVPDHVMESITGHLSRRMLEHYSHIRLEAKRRALEELDARRDEATEQEAVARPRQVVGVTSQIASQVTNIAAELPG